MESNIRILIIDDFASMRKILLNFLNKLGYFNIVEVDSPKKGWDLLQIEHFDLVISDFNSPDMTGLELLTRIRNHPEMKHQKFFMVTAEADKALLLRTKHLHIDGYILKPFKMDVLKTKLDALFEQK